MLKAYSKRHKNKVLVIGSTVFAFDKDGNTSAVNTGRNLADFDALLKIHGMVDTRDKPKSKEPKVAAQPKDVSTVKGDIALPLVVDMAAALDVVVPGLTEAAEGYEITKLKEELAAADAADAVKETVVEETIDTTSQEPGLEVKPEGSTESAVTVGTEKKKGRPAGRPKKTKETKE